MASQVRPKDRRFPDAQSLTDVLGKRVRARRADLGYSQGDLAEYMKKRGHRWTHGTVSRIETGQAEPTLSELLSLSFGLQASIPELLDPVLTGGGPVDIGVGDPKVADYVRLLLAGEVRILSLDIKGSEL
jgi:transcriptional regulator with XRE-family HTH domain